MSKLLQSLGAITGIGVTAGSLLMPEQPSLQTPVSMTPEPVATSSAESSRKTDSALEPLLAFLSKSYAPLPKLPSNEPQLAVASPRQPLPTETKPSAAPRRFIPASSAQSSQQKSVPVEAPSVVTSEIPKQSAVNTLYKSFPQNSASVVPTPLQPVAVPSSSPVVPLQPVFYPSAASSRKQPLPPPNVPVQPLATSSPETSLKQPLLSPSEPVQPLATPSPETSLKQPLPSPNVPVQPLATPLPETSPREVNP